MLSNRFNWNRLVQSAEWKVYKLFDDFGVTIYGTDSFCCYIGEFLDTSSDIADFISLINQDYHTKISENEDPTLWEIEAEMLKADFLRYFDGKEIPETIDKDLFKGILNNPEKELGALILSTIKNGYFSYLSGDLRETGPVYTVIQSEQNADSLCTTLIIKGEEFQGDYEIIDIFPSPVFVNSKQKTVEGMISYQSGNLGLLHSKTSELSFWNFFEQIQFYFFSEGKTNQYLFWGIAYPENSLFDSSVYNFAAAHINSLITIEIYLQAYEELLYENVKIIKTEVHYDGFDFPVFISEKFLPHKFENQSLKKLTFQVLVCGQVQPEEDFQELLAGANDNVSL